MKQLLLITGFFILAFSCRKSELKNNDAVDMAKEIPFCTVPNEAKFIKTHPNLGMNLRFGSMGDLSMIPDTVVLFIDNGGTVVGPSEWYPTTFTAGAISSTWMGYIVNKVIGDYSPFKVKVTTNVADYNAGNQYGRIRVVVGTGMTPYVGATGGISNVGAAWWGDNSTALVLTDNLANSLPAIAQSISHEAGHTFGLVHQADVSTTDCGLINAYAQGLGTGLLRWQPIMGAAHVNDSITTWHKGSTPYLSGNPFPNCYVQQDDWAILRSNLNVTADQDPSIMLGTFRSVSSTTPLNGVLNVNASGAADYDYFYIANSDTTSGNIAITSLDKNVDVAIYVYHKNGAAADSYDDVNSTDISPKAYSHAYMIRVAGTTTSPYTLRSDMAGMWKATITH